VTNLALKTATICHPGEALVIAEVRYRL